MTKVKVLSISVICLVLINLLLVGGILIGKPKHPHGPKDLIIEKLNFSSAQIETYNSYIQEHKSLVKSFEKDVLESKGKLYSVLINFDEVKEAEALEEILSIKRNMELLHLRHFKDIKSICNTKQLDSFNNLVEELPHLFSPPSHNRKP